MINALMLLLAGLGFAWLSVIIHEYGHWLTSLILRVPASAVRVNLNGRPPQVQLFDGREWLGPDHPSYRQVFTRYCASAQGAWLFIASGLIAESLIVAVAGMILLAIGLQPVALVWFGVSLIMFFLYAGFDLGRLAKSNKIYGDFSAMWKLATARTVLCLVVFLALKAGMVAAALQ